MIDLSQTIADQEAEIARLQTVNAELVDSLIDYIRAHDCDIEIFSTKEREEAVASMKGKAWVKAISALNLAGISMVEEAAGML